jgi:hypothetical protein
MTNRRHTLETSVRRLEAIAKAIQSGKSLTEVAAKFRVPLQALHAVVTPKRSLVRPSKIVTAEMLAAAADLIGQGKSLTSAAKALHVPFSTLRINMLKHGLRFHRLRPLSVLEKNLQLAITDYREGIKVEEISRRRNIPERTLYTHFRKLGVPLRQTRRHKPL